MLRFYCENIVEPTTELSPDQSHHLADVRRLRAGDEVELFDGQGGLAKAQVDSAAKRKVVLRILEFQKSERPSRGKIIIAASIPKGDRFEWLIAKCTELGADRIVPVLFSRTVKQPGNPKIMDRWANISIESAKQCGRIFLPQIDVPVGLTECLEMLKAEHPGAKLLFGCPDERGQSLLVTDIEGADLAAVIGPEGGFTEEEEAELDRAGAKMVRLTDTILRVETAAVTFAGILAARRAV